MDSMSKVAVDNYFQKSQENGGLYQEKEHW